MVLGHSGATEPFGDEVPRLKQPRTLSWPALGYKAQESHRANVVESGGVLQGGLQVGGFEVGHLGQNLLGGEAGGEELQHVGHADAHAANAGPAAALARVGGDAGEQGFHQAKILVFHSATPAPGAAGLVLGL